MEELIGNRYESKISHTPFEVLVLSLLCRGDFRPVDVLHASLLLGSLFSCAVSSNNSQFELSSGSGPCTNVSIVPTKHFDGKLSSTPFSSRAGAGAVVAAQI